MKTKQLKYTISEFRGQFQTDADCLEHIFRQRYPDGLTCPECGAKDCFYPVTERRAYACKCGHHTYPTAGTIFHKSPTSLRSWYFAVFLMSTAKNGVAALELQRHLGVTYKCAWRIAHQIRKLMVEELPPFTGVVEIDETYVGGRKRGKSRGRGTVGKTPVFGIVQRSGSVKTQVVPNVQAKTLIPLVEKSVDKTATVMSDELSSYKSLAERGYKHERIRHGMFEYVRGNIHTNTLDGFWSQMKRSIDGTHHHVSRKHLPKYAAEFAFRYNRRQAFEPMFRHVLRQLASQPALAA